MQTCNPSATVGTTCETSCVSDPGGGVTVAVAHQRIIAERERVECPRERIESLEKFSIETITREVASPLILRYEWLGDVGRAEFFVGLYAPERELMGAACFGYGPAPAVMRDLLSGEALCLERGACVPHAPKNAASFLIRHACHLVYRETGISRFFAYGDPMAGEYGGVYQAANWLYLGQGLNGGKKGRPMRYYVLRPGRDPANPANWQGTRELRRRGKHMTFAEARKAKWTIAKRPAKHVYAVNIGRDAKSWRRKIAAKPYPKPRPELTIQRVSERFIEK